MSTVRIVPRDLAADARPAPVAALPVGAAGVVCAPDRLAAVAEHERARLEGHRLGMEAGLAEGRAEAAIVIARVRALAEAWREQLGRLEEEVAGELLRLALALARQVVRSELEQRPEAVRQVLAEALHAIGGKARDLRLRANPEDVALLRPWLEEELPEGGWRVVEDPVIARGGCRLETPESEVDATLGTRWSRALALLGERGEP